MLRTPNLYVLEPGSIDGRAVSDGGSKRHVSDIFIAMRRSVKGCAIKEPPCRIKKPSENRRRFSKTFFDGQQFFKVFFAPVCSGLPLGKKNTLKNQRELREKSEPYLYYIAPFQLII